jgi:hypothetical protein
MGDSDHAPAPRGETEASGAIAGVLGISVKPFALILVKRLAVFLLLLFLIVVFYWAVGSFSSFLDETQLMLLVLLRWLSLGLAVISLLGMVLSLLFALFRRHSVSAAGLLGYAFLSALGVAGLVLAASLVALSRGVG